MLDKLFWLLIIIFTFLSLLFLLLLRSLVGIIAWPILIGILGVIAVGLGIRFWKPNQEQKEKIFYTVLTLSIVGLVFLIFIFYLGITHIEIP